MRVLTVRQPWAHAIIHMGKDVENRVRNIAGDYRGPVAIHVAKRLPPFQEHWDAGTTIAEITGRRPLFHDPATMGAIIGVVNLWAVHFDRDVGNCCPHHPNGGPGGSPWAERDFWHLCLNNARALREPILFKGALGLRRLDDETAARVLESIS